MINAPKARISENRPLHTRGGVSAAFTAICARFTAIFANGLGGFGQPLVSAVNSDPSLTPAVGAINEVAAGGDNWILVSPFGTFCNEAGIQVFDRQAANAIVSHHKSLVGQVGRLFRGLPIYVGHPDYAPRRMQYPDDTVYGRVSALQVREAGLYAKADWTAAGKAMVNEGDFRFQSPHWGMHAAEPGPKPSKFRPVQLYSLGLTNNPNLPVPPLPAQNQAPTQPNPMDKKRIAELLKLQPAANTAEVTDAQIEAAVQALLGQVDAANQKVSTLENNLTAANTRATTAEASLKAVNDRATAAEAERNDMLVTAAVNEGRITGADRAGWLGKLALPAEFAANSKALAELKPVVKTKSDAQDLGTRRQEAAAAPKNQIAAINEAVSAHMQTTGERDYTRAFAAVKTKQPALFETAAA